MKILKEIFCEDNPEKRNPLEVKVSSLYSALMENDKGEIETLDFIKKEYPLAGISEYYLIKLNHSNSGKDFAPVEGFFFYGNTTEARKHFSGLLPEKVLDAEFGNENQDNLPLTAWKDYDAEEP